MLKQVYSEFAARRREFQTKRNDLERMYSVEVINSDGSRIVIEDIQRLPVKRANVTDVPAV